VARLAAAAILFGGPVVAQQPGASFGQPPAQFGRAPTGFAAPSNRPVANYGYATPSPYSIPSPAPRPTTAADAVRNVPLPDRQSVGAGGRVLYFHKPAEASVPTPNPDTDPDGLMATAATADLPPATPPAVPEARVAAPVIPPRTLPPARSAPVEPNDPAYVPPPLPAIPPPGYPTATRAPNLPPPTISTSQKPRQEITRPAEADPKKRAEWTRLPSKQFIFHLYNDVDLEKIIVERVTYDIKKMQQDQKKSGEQPKEQMKEFQLLEPLQFPDLTEIRDRLAPPGVAYVPKTVNYPPGKTFYEPSYVIHRRLHFEEKNAERYGWDFGFAQPFISTLYFYKDALLWPNSLGSGLVTGFWDTGAGKCLPGSPTPYLLYPPGLTVTGMLFEGGIITGTAFILAPVAAAPAAAAAAAGR
jgi:hypothetical protein